jgi:hypothetical protein
MFPANLADIFVLILSHSVQEMKKLNMNIDWASHIFYSGSSSGHGNQGPRFSNFDSLGPHSRYCSFPSLLKDERSQFE